MPIERKKRKVQGGIRNTRIRLEDGEDAHKGSQDKKRLLAQSNGETTDIAR
jgi:hypothetical protein